MCLNEEAKLQIFRIRTLIRRRGQPFFQTMKSDRVRFVRSSPPLDRGIRRGIVTKPRDGILGPHWRIKEQTSSPIGWVLGCAWSL